jgi:hypothetical protein
MNQEQAIKDVCLIARNAIDRILELEHKRNKKWVGLTDEDIKKCIAATIKVTDPLLLDAIQAVVIDIESQLKDKNGG